MEPVKYTLASPVVHESITIKEVVFNRRPIAKDFRGLPSELDQDAEMVFISRLTGIELHLVEKLDGFDFIQLGGIVRSFLRSGPKTGPKQ